MAKPVYWISQREHLKALTSPIRHDIVDRLTALGPLSVKALAAALGRKPTAIYRHLVALERFGLVQAEMMRGARGRPAMIYRIAASRLRPARAPGPKTGRTPMAKIASAMARQAAREYAAAFQSDRGVIEGARRNHGFCELLTSPSPARLARINSLMDQLAQLIWTPDPKPGRPIRVTWFMSPSAGAQTDNTREAALGRGRAPARTRRIARRRAMRG
ncbi:MAG TPA: helix-turn-helix domain-containing protein [Rhizomicrobium sp.]|jgi:DNA-binding transcriptional ArsR family regulator|nr:helix-turn-helix domain-containing protein [Rhizomicrobium sp.]